MSAPRPRGALACALVLFAMSGACSKQKPPTPVPGGGTTETITGRERIGWEQPAPDSVELATFKYAMYVDNVRFELTEVTCGALAAGGTAPCSARLPAMSNGAHSLELAAFVDSGGIIEGGRSATLRVTVTGAGAPAVPALADGDTITTADGVRLRLELLAADLDAPASLAITPDRRIFAGSEHGALTIIEAGGARVTARGVGGDDGAGAILAIALSPSFERDRVLYLTQAVADDGRTAFRIARYRELNATLGERMVVLQHGPASSTPAAALRLGSDAKLYAAFDDGGSAAASASLADWSGKLLRLEPDGRTPGDQPSASPVLWHGLTSPRGFDWAPDGSTIWIADASSDGTERLRVVTLTGERPRQAGQRASFVLPRGFGVAAVAFYRQEEVPEFAGDLFAAGRDGGYILRVRFDPADPGRPVMTERLLEGATGTIRALEVGADGAIYFCTDSALWRLVGQR